MKRCLPACLLLLMGGVCVWAQAVPVLPRGKVLEGLRLDSRTLGRGVNYAIYLPPDYDLGSRRYPVVYLLHGLSDNETAWIQFGEVNVAADKAIGEGDIPAMIIVMPDAGVTWYINDYAGKVRYEDMFVQEFIPHVDATYRTRPNREFRAVSGLSMGGFGSLVYAMKHPDLFGACAPFSAGVMTDEEIVNQPAETYNRRFAHLFGDGLTGQARLTEHFRKNNPLDLARTISVETLKRVRWYFDCGDDDFLYKGNAALHVLFSDRKIPHEARMRDGAHSWGYWRTGITNALKFIGKSFHR